jgi:hypothetical protein
MTTPAIESDEGRPQISVPTYAAPGVEAFLRAMASGWDAEATVFEIARAGGWRLDYTNPDPFAKAETGYRLMVDGATVGQVGLAYGEEVQIVTLDVGANWPQIQAIVEAFEKAQEAEAIARDARLATPSDTPLALEDDKAGEEA